MKRATCHIPFGSRQARSGEARPSVAKSSRMIVVANECMRRSPQGRGQQPSFLRALTCAKCRRRLAPEKQATTKPFPKRPVSSSLEEKEQRREDITLAGKAAQKRRKKKYGKSRSSSSCKLPLPFAPLCAIVMPGNFKLQGHNPSRNSEAFVSGFSNIADKAKSCIRYIRSIRLQKSFALKAKITLLTD